MALAGYMHIIVYFAETSEKLSMIPLAKFALQVGAKDFWQFVNRLFHSVQFQFKIVETGVQFGD